MTTVQYFVDETLLNEALSIQRVIHRSAQFIEFFFFFWLLILCSLFVSHELGIGNEEGAAAFSTMFIVCAVMIRAVFFGRGHELFLAEVQTREGEIAIYQRYVSNRAIVFFSLELVRFIYCNLWQAFVVLSFPFIFMMDLLCSLVKALFSFPKKTKSSNLITLYYRKSKTFLPNAIRSGMDEYTKASDPLIPW